MRALRDQNTAKFVFEDVPLFLGLIGDLFPALDCPRVLQKALKNAVVDELEKEGMHHNDEAVFNLQVDKIIQLYETMLTRHTVMIVGPTGGGSQSRHPHAEPFQCSVFFLRVFAPWWPLLTLLRCLSLCLCCALRVRRDQYSSEGSDEGFPRDDEAVLVEPEGAARV